MKDCLAVALEIIVGTHACFFLEYFQDGCLEAGSDNYGPKVRPHPGVQTNQILLVQIHFDFI